MYKRAVLIFIVLTAVLLITAPLVVYSYSLSLLNTMPSKPQNITVTKEQLSEQWVAIEQNVTLENVNNITPYWIYIWYVADVINDSFSRKKLDPYDSISAMTSEIAIHHMRETEVKTNGMLWWHLLHANLGIWLQRNWEPEEILVKYKTL